MTASEQLPEDDIVFTAALNHYWAVHGARTDRAIQAINFYIVASAILVTAYTSAINGKHYSLAAGLAIAGLALNALTAAVVFSVIDAAARVEPVLTELQNRMAGRLRIDPNRMATFQAGITRRHVGIASVFGVTTLVNISGLLYALIH